MTEAGNTYRNLQELSNSEYKLTAGEANIIGWPVKNEADAAIGTVKELLFDSSNNAVRYLLIVLDELGVDLANKIVMIPIGLAHLHDERDEVILPNIHIDQFKQLPHYSLEAVNQALEEEVWAVIGSPAALRMEETIVEFDQAQFYSHHHFDQERFYQRKNKDQNSIADETELGDREAEKETIHDLIDRSKYQQPE
ncbi:PRC-barrel domain containing protein [Pedobacter frigidisoli]|uniref:PRC-barrel domain containing protein n=1 Tax=Pedobacter frigidisoli TaxID=2530455 RepID=A0A4R0P7F8_9SPHI|nr:PRC-barrel domain-containing protein [Pedobacter frigidisoli]TCD12960.1 PRC-barrel domain containing protein [Pedobacter frigidisoli]